MKLSAEPEKRPKKNSRTMPIQWQSHTRPLAAKPNPGPSGTQNRTGFGLTDLCRLVAGWGCKWRGLLMPVVSPHGAERALLLLSGSAMMVVSKMRFMEHVEKPWKREKVANLVEVKAGRQREKILRGSAGRQTAVKRKPSLFRKFRRQPPW
ncbi:unnamed protein product [Arabis nemorensis]|uniref:Uncharacterized protein n=1 Tax=Arabis nemorensis TaxID=586526 RepID=A0A565AYV2_9BRAS|nr:unnamed protein product [Arabis nemorensis]